MTSDYKMIEDNRVTVFMRHGMKNRLKHQVNDLKNQGYNNASMSGVLASIYCDYMKEHDTKDLRQLLIETNRI